MVKFILLIFVSFFISCAPVEDDETLVFERIVDGDTFIASGQRIRLWGVDAPEKDEPHSYTATLYLETLLEYGVLKCKFISEDRYQRSVMQCYVDGKDVASDLVKFGLARDDYRYSKGYYKDDEYSARYKKIGVWKNPISDRL